MWRMYDEAHVTTIGVRRDLHHRGFGRVLFAGLVQASYDMGAKWITLEVRTTNENAMHMYEGFGFKVIGRRKGYYTDNGEDAIVMWSDSIHSPRFRRAYESNLERIEADVRGLRRALLAKDGHLTYVFAACGGGGASRRLVARRLGVTLASGTRCGGASVALVARRRRGWD